MSAAGAAELRLQCIRVLQALSTFYIKESFGRSTIAFRMISDYTGLSLPRTAHVMRYLAHRGLVALSAYADAGRLDPLSWQKRGRCAYFAHFVANAPEGLRDENSLRALAPGCCSVRLPEYYTGCSTTVASNFNGVYNTFTSHDDCDLTPSVDLQERLFVPRLQVDQRETAMYNLWFLVSSLTPTLLFRRELLILYSTGHDASSGADIAERGPLALLLLNDEALQEEKSVDLIAYECLRDFADDGYCVYETLGGSRFTLEGLTGIARFDEYVRRYAERGVCRCGVRLIEMSSRTDSHARPLSTSSSTPCKSSCSSTSTRGRSETSAPSFLDCGRSKSCDASCASEPSQLIPSVRKCESSKTSSSSCTRESSPCAHESSETFCVSECAAPKS